jgi:hypothetical protein
MLLVQMMFFFSQRCISSSASLTIFSSGNALLHNSTKNAIIDIGVLSATSFKINSVDSLSRVIPKANEIKEEIVQPKQSNNPYGDTKRIKGTMAKPLRELDTKPKTAEKQFCRLVRISLGWDLH